MYKRTLQFAFNFFGKQRTSAQTIVKQRFYSNTTTTTTTTSAPTTLTITTDDNFDFNKESPVWACNEWDPLKEMIIGRADYAVVPPLLPEVKACINKKQWAFFEKNVNKYWVDVIPEHWKKLMAELDEFVRVCEGLGIKVQRPDIVDHGKNFTTPYINSKGFYSAMPRDILMVVADEIIEAPMTWRPRYFEFYAYRSLINDYWRRGCRWSAAPKPKGSDELFDEGKEAGFVSTEFEPTFDAADFIRAGRDIFGQRSQVTNKAGIEWVRRHLKPRGIRVHEVNFHDPRPMHVDSTMVLVKPGIVLRNPDRPCKQEKFFTDAGWKVIEVPRPNMPENHPLYMSSEWIAMNSLTFDPNHVFVEKNEPDVIKMYEKIGLTPIPVSIRHMNSIGGGFHCWTLDVRREGKMESYF